MTPPLTEHQLRAAIRVAQLIDAHGNRPDDVSLGYRMVATQGQYSPDALRSAESLLVRAGLLSMHLGRIRVTSRLRRFVSLNDESELLRVFSELLAVEAIDRRIEVGVIGEEHVANVLRRELEEFGRSDLAKKVQRVSLLSDRLGYDVQAPMLSGVELRRVEVKTQRNPQPGIFQFFITRHEYNTGRACSSEWALVLCSINGKEDKPTIEGWCRASTLPAYLPDDRNSRWMEARVRLPSTILIEGFPRAV